MEEQWEGVREGGREGGPLLLLPSLTSYRMYIAGDMVYRI